MVQFQIKDSLRTMCKESEPNQTVFKVNPKHAVITPNETFVVLAIFD